jgi:hypothetical protein
MAMLILLMFMFWVFVAHTIFALFMGLSAMTNVSSSFEVLWTGNGLIMLAVGSAVGAGFAAVLFSVTAGGLPMLLEREVDFVSAMIRSVQAVTANAAVMAVWGTRPGTCIGSCWGREARHDRAACQWQSGRAGLREASGRGAAGQGGGRRHAKGAAPSGTAPWSA